MVFWPGSGLLGIWLAETRQADLIIGHINSPGMPCAIHIWKPKAKSNSRMDASSLEGVPQWLTDVLDYAIFAMERFLKGYQPNHSLTGAMCVGGTGWFGCFPIWTPSLNLGLALQSSGFFAPHLLSSCGLALLLGILAPALCDAKFISIWTLHLAGKHLTWNLTWVPNQWD